MKKNNRLVCIIMGQNCEKHIGMCLESVKDADTIIYLDGGSTDNTLVKLMDKGFMLEYNPPLPKSRKQIIENKWNSDDPQMNGKQRNFYLNYLKKHYPEDWCLVLDADEVVEGLDKLKEFIQNPLQDVYSVMMEHFIGDLGHLDATNEVHLVPHRLFKISKAKEYPLHSHPVLTPVDDAQVGVCGVGTIWHLGHLPIDYMKYIVKRTKQHQEDSVIHNKGFLEQWKNSHLFGQYPTRPCHPKDIPEIILKEFELDVDEFYFMDRLGLEAKHFIMAKQWINNFIMNENDTLQVENVLDYGCGVGHYGYVIKNFLNKKYLGIDASMWAKENTPYKDLDIKQGQIQVPQLYIDNIYDLVLCIDILEHLTYEELDKALNEIKNNGKNYIFSIPFLGDPNLDLDKTHIIKENKEWWVKKLSGYFKIKDAPQDWLFHQQILIGELK